MTNQSLLRLSARFKAFNGCWPETMLELLDFIGRNTNLDKNHIASRTLKAMRSSAEGSPAAADAWLREALAVGAASDLQAAE